MQPGQQLGQNGSGNRPRTGKTNHSALHFRQTYFASIALKARGSEFPKIFSEDVTAWGPSPLSKPTRAFRIGPFAHALVPAPVHHHLERRLEAGLQPVHHAGYMLGAMCDCNMSYL